MASINIDTGRKEISVIRDGENAGRIFFSPADPAIIARLTDMRKALEEIDFTKFDAAIQAEDSEAFSEELKQLDRRIRDQLDYAFGSPVSDTVFGSGFAFALSGGTSYAEQFVTGALKIIRDEAAKAQKAAQARQDKYLQRKR